MGQSCGRELPSRPQGSDGPTACQRAPGLFLGGCGVLNLRWIEERIDHDLPRRLLGLDYDSPVSSGGEEADLDRPEQAEQAARCVARDHLDRAGGGLARLAAIEDRGASAPWTTLVKKEPPWPGVGKLQSCLPPEPPNPGTSTSSRGGAGVNVAAQLLTSLLEPPRVAPAAQRAGLSKEGTSFHHAAKPVAALREGTGVSIVLCVRIDTNSWESIIFSERDDIFTVSAEFLLRHNLSSCCQEGLLAKMQQMVLAGQVRATVDIVDLV